MAVITGSGNLYAEHSKSTVRRSPKIVKQRELGWYWVRLEIGCKWEIAEYREPCPSVPGFGYHWMMYGDTVFEEHEVLKVGPRIPKPDEE